MQDTPLGLLIDVMPDWGSPKSPKKVRIVLSHDTEAIRSYSSVMAPSGTEQRIGKREYPRIESIEYSVPFRMTGPWRKFLHQGVTGQVVVPLWPVPISISTVHEDPHDFTVSTVPGQSNYIIPGVLHAGSYVYCSTGNLYQIVSLEAGKLTLDGTPVPPFALYPIVVGYLKDFKQGWTNKTARQNEMKISVVEGSVA